MSAKGQRPICSPTYSYMIIFQVDMFLYVRMDVWVKMTQKKRKQHLPQGGDASTVSAGTCRVGKGEQGEARPALSPPRGGPHLDLGRSRLKTCSKSDFSIAETTGPTYLPGISIHIFTYIQWLILGGSSSVDPG